MATGSGSDQPKKSGFSVAPKARPPAYLADRGFYRRVAYMLGGIVVVCVGLGFWAYMCSDENEVPDYLIAIASTAIGALAGVFAGSARG